MDFIAEFQKLLFTQPTYNLRTVQNTNCPYVHMVSHSKDSYMCFSSYKLNNCGYCHYNNQLSDCYDCYFAIKCELCYECISCTSCYDCDFCQECVNCSGTAFSYDCRGCNDCFGCVGLRQKNYYIFNEPYSKEEYFKKLKSIDAKSAAGRAEVEKKVGELSLAHAHLASVQINTQDSFGDHIVNAKNCFWSFDTTNSQDCSYVFHTENIKDCYDSELISDSELCYECGPVYNLYNCNFCIECGDTKNSEFYVRCFNSHDLFGCVGVNHGEYMILNKKYEKDEYMKKVAEIKDQLRSEKKYANFLPDVWM